MKMFDDENKIYMTFELRGHGKTQTIMCEYDDMVHWSELLDDVVGQIEASWGYTFDIPLETEKGQLGIYHAGKKNESK